jgi:ADP-ribose pyrophosphatase YjhB (NUDIX family)
VEKANRKQVFRAYPGEAGALVEPMGFCRRCGHGCGMETVAGRNRPGCGRCGYVHYRNPTPGVAVVISECGRVLLGRRRRQARYGGLWALPAGFVEFEEDFLTAARREAREETGLDVEVTGILNVSSNHLAPDLHALVVAIAAHPVGGTLTAGDDLCALAWVAVAGPFPPLAYEADAELLALLGGGAVPVLPADERYARGRGATKVDDASS